MERKEKEVKNWEFVEGKRGSQILLADNHTFHHDKGRYYRCSFRNMRDFKPCPVRVIEKERRGEKYFVYSNGCQHTHESKYIDRSEMKKRIDTIVEYKLNMERNLMYYMTKTFEKKWGIKSTTYYKYILNEIKKQKEIRRENVEYNDCDYILYDDEDLLIIVDPFVYPYISLCDTIYIDGTFKVAPKGMYQLCTIHGTIGEEYYQLFYCVMKNKKIETYEKIYSIISKETQGIYNGNIMKKNKGPKEKRRITEMMGDFEIMNMKFFTPNIKFCYFHFCQIIKRQKIDKCSEGIERDLMLLPLVPLHRVKLIYKYIETKYTRDEYKK